MIKSMFDLATTAVEIVLTPVEIACDVVRGGLEPTNDLLKDLKEDVKDTFEL